jgi:hypothetical protein
LSILVSIFQVPFIIMGSNEDKKGPQANSLLLLQPGERIKPLVGLEDVPQLVQTYFGFSVQKIRECNGYDDENFYVEVIMK